MIDGTESVISFPYIVEVDLPENIPGFSILPLIVSILISTGLQIYRFYKKKLKSLSEDFHN